MDRLGFFQQAVLGRNEPLTEAEILETVFKWDILEKIRSFGLKCDRCIHRDDEDLMAMQERRGRNPSSTKEDLLRMRVKTEEQEFKTGYYTPELTNLENMRALQRWDGRLESMGLVKMVRVVQSKD